ncbi:hypothetical protein CCMSSC00406_0008966 [Pleurotus cornucopiae]|uniref:Uncharacterized protein n=1 Tax=Pleurotus cornucopiae TaxID=5321 RepID=A0ACB7J8T3_PLECO|nr:hypothetical protein CCMSSC00406_0008966 [Pleurotus cornucopiae]
MLTNAPRPSSVEKDNDSREEKVVSESSEEGIDFGGESRLPPPPVLTSEQEAKLWRKIDLRLMPILSLMYLFSFLDRVNKLRRGPRVLANKAKGNAKLQGLTTQLNLIGNEYNIALTMFFIPYCIFECPSNLVLKRFRPSRWLPGITVAWGTVMTLMGIVKTYPQLVGVRICLGVAEAGLFPGVVYYLTLWYPRHMLQYRIGIFFGAASVSGAFSGLLAFGISFMSGTKGLLGWSWIFILEGIATVAVGILAFFVLVDFPVSAKFLTPEERAFVVWRKKYDSSSVGEEERFAARHVWAAFKDWQVWLHVFVYLSVITPLFGITLFLPSIINSFGHTAAISQLLTVPPYVFASTSFLLVKYRSLTTNPAIVLGFFAYYSDKLRLRSVFILAGLLMCLVGFAINISDAPSGVKYFGTFLVVGGSYAAFPGVVAWNGNNLAGQYKRGVGMALQIGVGNLGGAVASNIYRTQDSPRYLVGHGVELLFVGIGLICVPLIVGLYTVINRRRDAVEKEVLEKGETKKFSPQELRELGDRGPEFRYML